MRLAFFVPYRSYMKNGSNGKKQGDKERETGTETRSYSPAPIHLLPPVVNQLGIKRTKAGTRRGTGLRLL